MAGLFVQIFQQDFSPFAAAGAVELKVLESRLHVCHHGPVAAVQEAVESKDKRLTLSTVLTT